MNERGLRGFLIRLQRRLKAAPMSGRLGEPKPPLAPEDPGKFFDQVFLCRTNWRVFGRKVTCPGCGSDHVGEIKSRRLFQCKNVECRKQFSVKVGTIFEDSA